MVDEAVATCPGCGMHRLCRKYKGLWLCLTGPWNCWRHRKSIYANHRNKEEKEDK